MAINELESVQLESRGEEKSGGGVNSPATVGAEVRRLREAAGWRVEELAAHLRISARQLVWLESGEWQRLPTGVFVRGVLRAIGRWAGVDPSEWCAVAQQMLPESPRQLQPTSNATGEVVAVFRWWQRPGVRWAGILGVLGAVVGGYLHWFGVWPPFGGGEEEPGGSGWRLQLFTERESRGEGGGATPGRGEEGSPAGGSGGSGASGGGSAGGGVAGVERGGMPPTVGEGGERAPSGGGGAAPSIGTGWGMIGAGGGTTGVAAGGGASGGGGGTGSAIGMGEGGGGGKPAAMASSSGEGGGVPMGGGGSSGGGGGNYERGGGGLVVRASRGDSWLRVTAADGQVVYEGLLRMGSERTFPAERGPFALHAGNGGALEVLWQGRPVTIRGGVSRFQVPEGGGGGAGTGQRSQGGETMGTSPRLQGETTGVSQRPPGGTAGGSQRAQGGGTGTGQRSQGGETMGISPRLQGETTGVSQRPRGGEGAGSE